MSTLCSSLENQGYSVFFDNFYTSTTLVSDLFAKGLPSSGTTCENRRGFPVQMKNGKKWGQKVERGSMRWHRDGFLLTQQWKDTKVVTMASSLDIATESVTVSQKVKVNGKFEKKEIPQPKSVSRYNQFMNGVDKSDQLLSKYNLLRKCLRWWKTLFFHIIDIALINGCILFSLESKGNPENKGFRRPGHYSFLEFREVVRQLANLPDYGNPPAYRAFGTPSQFETVHIPKFSDVKRNC